MLHYINYSMQVECREQVDLVNFIFHRFKMDSMVHFQRLQAINYFLKLQF